jgi:hypothetical protein
VIEIPRIIKIGFQPNKDDERIKLTLPSQATADLSRIFGDKIPKVYIVLEEFGPKNIIPFLKHCPKDWDVVIYAKRKPKADILKLCNGYERFKDGTPSFGVAIKAVLTPNLSMKKRLEILRASKIAPRILLQMAVKKSNNPRVIRKLLEIDAAGEPTYEAMVCIFKEVKV